jgi:hypothetical protein
MAYAVFESTEMIGQLFGACQAIPDETGDTLPHRIIETLAMIGCPGMLGDRLVLRSWHHPCVDGILISIQCCLLAIRRRQIGPYLFCTVVAPIADMQGNPLACLLVHGHPDPLFVGLLLRAAPQLIYCHLPPPKDPIPWGRYQLPMAMVREGCEARHEKAHQPPDTATTCAANTMAGNGRATQAFPQRPWLPSHHAVCGVHDKLPTTLLTLIVLLPSMQMAIILVLLSPKKLGQAMCYPSAEINRSCFEPKIGTGDVVKRSKVAILNTERFGAPARSKIQ